MLDTLISEDGKTRSCPKPKVPYANMLAIKHSQEENVLLSEEQSNSMNAVTLRRVSEASTLRIPPRFIRRFGGGACPRLLSNWHGVMDVFRCERGTQFFESGLEKACSDDLQSIW